MGSCGGVLHAEGVLDLHAPVQALIPELGTSGHAGSTINQVLDMRSGTRFTKDYNVTGSDMTRIDIASDWRPALPIGLLATGMSSRPCPPNAPHGGPFNYGPIETDVLAWALERAGSRWPKCSRTGYGNTSVRRAMPVYRRPRGDCAGRWRL
ncbi:MAG: serine hydrolase [Rhodobacterales bacterium]|nr:serine hydrolase [Rhodobacterales bacterium]